MSTFRPSRPVQLRAIAAIVGVAIAAAIATAGCGAGQRATSATATPAPANATEVLVLTPASPPQLSPTPTETPAPTLQGSRGWLVYLRGQDLYVGALDGSGEQRLTNGGLGASYVGYVREGATIWLYYATVVKSAIPESPPWTGPGALKLYRTKLGGSGEEELLSLEPGDYGPDYAMTASISPDGRRIAYTNRAGLHVREVKSGDDTLVLRSADCQLTPPIDLSTCRGYLDPSWSADGQWLLVNRLFYETGVATLVDPAHPETARELQRDNQNVGDGYRRWAPSGTEFCLSGFFNSYGGAGLMSVDDLNFRDLGDTVGVPPRADTRGLPAIFASDCEWSPDGHIGMEYATMYPTASRPGGRVLAVFDRDGQLLQQVDLPSGEFWSNAFVWLPDSAGAIIEHTWPAHASVAVLLDGQVRALPFAAERVLGAIPSPAQ